MSDADNLYTLITGASSGIGKALAIRLSGARRLILHGRDSRRLNETLSECANPHHHLIWPFDLLELWRIGLRTAPSAPEVANFLVHALDATIATRLIRRGVK